MKSIFLLLAAALLSSCETYKSLNAQKTEVAAIYNRGGITEREAREKFASIDSAISQKDRNIAAMNAFATGVNQSYQATSMYDAGSTRSYTPTLGSHSTNRYDPDSLANPYGAGSRYKSDGLMNPYSRYGSRYSNESWTNPYATNAPKLYNSRGEYRGRLSTNKYDPDSVSNPYGRFGSKYSPDCINNPYGAGNPYSSEKIYAVPQR